jgi:hypothetical protein
MLRLGFLFAIVFFATESLHAGPFGCPCCGSDGICILKAEPGTEKEKCYDVECEEVCIPPVRFPWESCRAPKCGRVRVVARLKHDEREEPVCKYEWQVVCPRCGRPVAKGDAKADRSVPPAPASPKSPARGRGAQGMTAPPMSPPAPPPSGRSRTR